MRCLYCGKGLALLKRLRGGGEFCSDAHRLKYQEEYNQLALSRLLQAQVPEEPAKGSSAPQNGQGPNTATPKSEPVSAAAASPAPKPATAFPGPTPATALQKPAPATALENPPPAAAFENLETAFSHFAPPPAPSQSGQVKAAQVASATATLDRPAEVAPPVREPQTATHASGAAPAQPEIGSPAPMAGFVLELPRLQQAVTPSMAASEVEFEAVLRPEQPYHDVQAVPPEADAAVRDEAPWAGALRIEIAENRARSGRTIRSSSVEVRESARPAPMTISASVMDLPSTGPDSASAGPDWSCHDQPLDFTIPPLPPENAGAPWVDGAQEFAALQVELGDLARLALATEGSNEFADLPEKVAGAPVQLAPAVAEPAPQPSPDAGHPELPTDVIAAEPQPVPRTVEPEPQPAPAAEIPMEPQRQSNAPAVSTPIEPVRVESVQIDRAFLRSLGLLSTVETALAPAEAPPPSANVADGRDVAEESNVAEERNNVDVERAAAVDREVAAERDVAAESTEPAETSPSSPSAPPSSAEAASPVPERVTRPLPLTLHGFPPARGKAAQIYTAALRAVPEILIPSTGALPLRPVMVFAPAAAAAPALVAPPPTPANREAASGDEASKNAANSNAKKPGPAGDRAVDRPGDRVAEAARKRRSASSSIVETAPPKPAEPSESKAKTAVEPKPETKTSAAETKSEPKGQAKAEQAKSEQAKSEQAKSGTSKTPDASIVDLGLPSLQIDAVERSRMPAPTVIGVVLAVIAAIGVGVYELGFKTTKPVPAAPATPLSDVVEAGEPLSIADGGWIDDWAPQPPNPPVLRVLSILRGSLPMSDYRMEFEAQIEAKALGWVFRALNPKNYYVNKLEIVKPGIEPTVEVVHFAMIDGQEETRARVPLPVKVRVDTSYKVRFEALGDRFTTYVQDQKVDEWTDNRIGRGGAGLYRERGESALLKGTVRMVLIAKRK